MNEDCPSCEGCGKVANDTDQTPWTHWINLPEQSKLAIYMGLVHPVRCARCGGTGKVEATNEGKSA